MGQAERNAARQARLTEQQRAAQRQQEVDAAEQAFQEQYRRIEQLRVQALDALRSAGWPNGQLIKPYGPFFTRKKAGWQAGSILTSMHGEAGSRPVYLLANGKWSAPNDYEETTVNLLRKRRTSGIEEGLRQLIRTYGGSRA